jgi:hypothetical protein
MIRDLMYPEDARKVIEALHGGLRYDAAIAVMGKSCSKSPLEADTPDFSTGIRCGGVEEDKAVRREAEGLLSRYSFISMVSRFETHARQLLLQRRVLEDLRTPGRKMAPDRLWNILRRVNEEIRLGPVIVCTRLLVEHPSPELEAKMKWLEGIYKIRNCLAHRLGTVEMVDVKAPGASLDSVKDSDTLKAVWLRLKATVDGREIVDFPHQVTGPGKGEITFDEYQREWKIGDRIDITPLECQFVAISLSVLGNQVLADFEREMNAILKDSAERAPDKREIVKKNPRPSPIDGVRDQRSDLTTHFADLEFRKGTDRGEVLPTDHQWVCNASLPSWPRILDTGLLRHLPCVYLCERHAAELDLRSLGRGN